MSELQHIKDAVKKGASQEEYNRMRTEFNVLIGELNYGLHPSMLTYQNMDKFAMPKLNLDSGYLDTFIKQFKQYVKSRKTAFPGKEKELLDRIKEANNTREQALELVNLLKGKDDYDLYLRLAGEIEARNVQKRMSYPAAIRSASPFNTTLEYPGEAIVPSSFSLAARKGSEKFARVGKQEPSLPIFLTATNTDGTNATKNSLVATSDDSPIWGNIPDLPELKEAGLSPAPIIMRYGHGKSGFMHIVIKHGQWIMDAMDIDNPVEASKAFIESVLAQVEKLHKGGKNKTAILKRGPKERYYIVSIGPDAIDKSFYSIKSAFVAEHDARYDEHKNFIGEDGSLRLRIPVSSLGESQRLRVPTEQQSLNSEHPGTAEPSSTEKLPKDSHIVKDISIEEQPSKSNIQNQTSTSSFSNFVNEYAQKKVDYFKKHIKENKTLKDWEKNSP